MIGATRHMTVDFGPVGNRVNPIASDRVKAHEMAWTWDPTGYDKRICFAELRCPCAEPGRTEDIAKAVALQRSNETSFLLGTVPPEDDGLAVQRQEHPDLDSCVGRFPTRA